MAATTVPGFLTGFRTLLLVRPALAGVAVHLLDRPWADSEAVVLSRVSLNAARFLGWGSGPDSLATIEPLTLTGYVFAEIPTADDAGAAKALVRAGALLVEVMQQLRDDPTIAGALVAPQRLQPPLMLTALWGAWPADQEGAGITRVRVDFTIAWEAVS